MKILVVDDEPPARARLVRLLAELGHHEVGEAHDVPSASAVLAREPIDVLLLDVTMPGIDGLSFAETARLPAVVFVTGDPAHAARAFDVEAADFVTKPVRRERLVRALERAAARAAVAVRAEDTCPPVRLRVVDGSSERFVDARAIDVLTAEHKVVVFRWAGREAILRASLDELEATLGAAQPPTDHIRVHRSHLVRLDAIVALKGADEGTRAALRDGTLVPVSRRALSAVRAALRARAVNDT